MTPSRPKVYKAAGGWWVYYVVKGKGFAQDPQVMVFNSWRTAYDWALSFQRKRIVANLDELMFHCECAFCIMFKGV